MEARHGYVEGDDGWMMDRLIDGREAYPCVSVTIDELSCDRKRKLWQGAEVRQGEADDLDEFYIYRTLWLAMWQRTEERGYELVGP